MPLFEKELNMTGRIRSRIVDVKRHTKGYMIDGMRVTRGVAVKMARRGRIPHVTAKRGVDGWYISSLPSREASLYDLPVKVEN